MTDWSAMVRRLISKIFQGRDTVSPSDDGLIPAGFDFLRTEPEGAIFRFDRAPIPAGFFSPRSQAFATAVRFRGRSLPRSHFAGLDVSHVDTVIARRKAVAPPVRRARASDVPLEIVGLALESMEPIEVRVGRHVESWDVEVDLSPRRRSKGRMSISKRDAAGGTFDSELQVFPRFRFVRRCDGTEKVLDTGAWPVALRLGRKTKMRSTATPWRHKAPATLRLPGLNDNFVAGAPGAFAEESEACAHPSGEAASCSVIIIAQARCLVVGRDRPFTGRGSPDGGSYSWSMLQGGTRASIVSGANSRNCEVRGVQASGSANDIRLLVRYQAPNGSQCEASIGLTTLDATLELRSAGQWDPDNDTPQDRSLGVPCLGPVSPGIPVVCPDATGFFKNIEIRATIKPNAPSLGCEFDFKRTYQGRVGVLTPNGNWLADPADCPNGGCDDDSSNVDEDLSLSPSGTIFDVDTPGLRIDPPDCTTAVQGAQRISCRNFTNWLEVDGQRLGRTVEWHAETRLQCQSGTWVEISGSVGEGHIACTVNPVAPGLPFSVSKALDLVASESFEDRAKGHQLVAGVHETGQLSEAERSELIDGLVRSSEGRLGQQHYGSTLMVAVQLLGLLRAREAGRVFLDYLLSDFEVPAMGVHPTLAGTSLARLGSAAIPLIVDQASTVTDPEWAILERVLRLIENQSAVRRAVCAALDAGPPPLAEDRLDSLLRPRQRVAHVRRFTAPGSVSQGNSPPS